MLWLAGVSHSVWRTLEARRQPSPCFRDLIGAGAIIQHLPGSQSPEAQAAVAAFRGAEPDLCTVLKQCSSGKELISMGFERDIPPTAERDVDDCAPMLKDGAYRKTEQ